MEIVRGKTRTQPSRLDVDRIERRWSFIRSRRRYALRGILDLCRPHPSLRKFGRNATAGGNAMGSAASGRIDALNAGNLSRPTAQWPVYLERSGNRPY